jgi:hypothetical protein
MQVRICEGCPKEHVGEYGSGRFCSNLCARAFSTRAKRKEINECVSKKLQGNQPSEQTRQKLRDAHKRGAYKNCNPAARIEKMRATGMNQRLIHLENWKKGVASPSERTCKNLLILERGEKCERCGWCEVNPTSNTIPIELEHIDGNCYNNTYANTMLLCPNCHSLTSTFRALNAGKGRGRRMYKLVSQWAKEKGVKIGGAGGS